jgi:glycosyltransferase involved in cell wall biosynthesis
VNAAGREVTVVVATRDRAERLSALLESLRRQTVGPDIFETIVVDDGSRDGTPALLSREERRDELRLRAVRRERSGGPGEARNAGWCEARSPLIAFIDDDCIAAPRWLEAGMAACRAHPGAIVQGRTEPMPGKQADAFAYTVQVRELGPLFQTCNIFYPRSLLAELDGFDTAAFPGGGEDADLAWRAIESGTETAYAPEAQVFHAVHHLGVAGHLRWAWHWTPSILAWARHPGLRRQHLFRGAFWNVKHYGLLRLLLIPLIPRRLRLLRRWLVWRYLAQLGQRSVEQTGRGSALLLLMPYLFLHDLVEIVAVVRGAIRYRTIVL